MRAIAAFLRTVLSREALPPPPAAPERPRARTGGSLLAMLFRREALPPELPPAAPAPSSPGPLRLLFAPEPLPLEPEAPPRTRPALLRALFAPERLPEDPPAPERPRRNRWLRWLFGREPLDRPHP
jgi:hypothetical protein